MRSAIIEIARITDGDRLRPVDADWAALLADRMREGGLGTPIWLREAEPDGTHPLIAGAHRLAAARLLGWDTIAATIFDVTALQARLMEIEENLIRAELMPLDRAVFLHEHKSVWEGLYPETRHGGTRRGKSEDGNSDVSSRHDGDLPIAARFTIAAQEKFGFSERTVQRAVAIAEGLAPDVRAALAGTWLSRAGGELERLARLDQRVQRQLLPLLIGEEATARSVAEALAAGTARPAVSEVERQVRSLHTAWRKAGARARRQFLADLRAAGDLSADD